LYLDNTIKFNHEKNHIFFYLEMKDYNKKEKEKRKEEEEGMDEKEHNK